MPGSPPAPIEPSPLPTYPALGNRLDFHQVWMVGDAGWALVAGSVADALVRTSDGGRVWHLANPPAQPSGLWPVDGETAWIVGAAPAGGVLVARTTNGGITWDASKLGMQVPSPWDSIAFAGPVDGWIALPGQPASEFSFQGVTVYRTTDGGATWRLVQSRPDPWASPQPGAVPGGCGKQGGIAAMSSSKAWLAGGCAGVDSSGLTFEETTDGGASWHRVDAAWPAGVSCAAAPCNLHAPRFLRGFGYATAETQGPDGHTRNLLVQTRDGGLSWQVSELPGGSALAMVDEADGLSGAFYRGSSIGTYATHDGARSWAPAGRGFWFSQIDCVAFLDCWAIETSPSAPWRGLYRSSDGGQTWVALNAVLA